ncbi:MAG: PglZ domain-containing protein [bacterium]
MSTTLNEIIKKILLEKAYYNYNFLIDQNGMFKSIMYELRSNESIQIEFLDYNSIIALKNILNKKDPNKVFILYTTENIDITSYIAKGNGANINITVEDILSNDTSISKGISEEINLTTNQFQFFIKYYEKIIEKTKLESKISQDSIESILTSLYLGDPNNLEEVIINIIKGEENLSNIREAGLYDHLMNNVKKELKLDLTNVDLSIPDLFNKILLSLSKKSLGDKFPAMLESEILNINDEELYKLFNVIKNNSYHFKDNLIYFYSFIEKNMDFEYIMNDIDYYTPYFFEKYVFDNLEKYKDIQIKKNSLWNQEMLELGTFVLKIQTLSELLNQYISYNLSELSMDYIIKEYKEKIYEIDQLFRNVSSLQENFFLSNNRILNKIAQSKVFKDLTKDYFDVLNKINSSFIEYYPDLIKNRKDAYNQTDTFKRISVNKNTVIIISDGLRYEMAKEIIDKDVYDKIEEYPIYSEIPSETVVCYNSYFIDNEQVILNSNNIFDLKDVQGKKIFKIKEWRLDKLNNIFENVIDFNDFKVNENYNGIVLLQQNLIDDDIHKDKDSRDISKNLDEIKEIIMYCYKRGFDVLLLSDHGFINVKKKIDEGNRSINPQKKKDRYLIMDSDDNIDYAFYMNDYPTPDFVDVDNKRLCFINSINTLRETGKYTHGGISLQENIIPTFYIKHKQKEKDNSKRIIEIESGNELKLMITNINLKNEYFLKIYKDSKMMHMEHIHENNQKVTYSIRAAKPGERFIAILVENEAEIERSIFEKKNLRSVDSDLDIF